MAKFVPDGVSFSKQNVRQALMYALQHADEFDKCVVVLSKYDAETDITHFSHSAANVTLIESLGLLEVSKSYMQGRKA